MVVIYDSNEEVCPFSKFLKKKGTSCSELRGSALITQRTVFPKAAGFQAANAVGSRIPCLKATTWSTWVGKYPSLRFRAALETEPVSYSCFQIKICSHLPVIVTKFRRNEFHLNH